MKTLVTIFALSAATIFTTQAQDTRKAPKEDMRMEKTQPQNDMSQQVKMHTDRMTKDLELNANQRERLMAENKVLYADMASLESQKADAVEMKKMKEKSVARYDAKVKDILDDDQYKKYTEMKGDYMNNMHPNKDMKTKKEMDMKEDMRRK